MADKKINSKANNYVNVTPSFVKKGNPEDSRVLWSSRTPFNAYGEPTDEMTKEFEELQKNAEIASGFKNNPAIDIWKRVDSGSNLQNMYGQSSIESIRNLKPGDYVTFFDMENVGTPRSMRNSSKSLGWVAPLELAAQRVQVQDDYTLKHIGDPLSLLMKPSKEEEHKINSLINKIYGMTNKTWTGLTDDEWRSANDLILYAHDNPFDSKNGLFERRKGVTHVRMQNRLDQAADGTVFSSKHVELMKKGLKNLLDHGNKPDVIANQLLSYFKSPNGGTTKLGGHNIKNFDIPMIMDWIEERLAPNVSNSGVKKALLSLKKDLSNVQTIDSLQSFNVMYKDKGSRFGPNGMTLESTAAKREIGTKVAHLGVADVVRNIDLFNDVIRKDGLIGIAHGTHTGPIAKFNTSQIVGATMNGRQYVPGTSMFAINGLTVDTQKGKWDNVLRMTDDGKFEPLYKDFRIAPLSKDTTYTLHSKSYQQMQDGKSYYTAIFRNEETQNFHMIARENIDDLRNIIHRGMVPLEDAPYAQEATKLSNIDKARREWDKMFSWERGGGRYLIEKYSKLHDVFKDYAGVPMNPKAMKAAILRDPRLQGKHGSIITETMYRNYMVMKDRFGEEFGHINEFLGRLDRELPGKGTPASHNVALRTYAKLIDQNFGENKSAFDKPQGRYGLTVTVGNQTSEIDLSSQRTASQGIKNMVDAKNQTSSVIKKRLENLLVQAQAAGMSSSEVARIRGEIKDLKGDKSPYLIVDDISAYLYQKASTDSTFGMKQINLDDPTKMVDSRRALLTKDELRAQIQTESISHAHTFHGSPWDKGSLARINISDPQFRKLIDQHNSSMGKLYNHAVGSKGATIRAITAEETLGGLINSFRKDGVEAQLVYNGEKDTLNLVLATTEVANRVFGLQANEILAMAEKGQNVAHVTIPMLNGKGDITMPGNTRIAYSKIFDLGNNELGLGTAFEQGIFGVSKRSRKAREMLKEGKVKDVTSMLKVALNEEVQKYAINSQYIDPTDMRRQDTRLSKTARYARSGHIDMTVLAERWYNHMYEQTDPRFNEKLKQKKSLMERDKSLSFYNTLSKDELRKFHITIDDFATQFGLRTDMHNIKDTHALNGLRSSANASVQNLLPFGYLDQMSREKIVKHGNYLPLDKDTVVENLRFGLKKANPNMTKNQIETRINRILNRGLMTDVGMEYLEGETAFLNFRTVYQDNTQLAHRMKKAGINDELASTYDGSIIVREDAASALTTAREQKITLTDGAVVPEKMKEMFEKSGMFEAIKGEDGKISYMLKKGTSVIDERSLLENVGEVVKKVGSAHYGHITVGQIAKNDTMRAENFYTGHNRNVWVKGFNAEKNQLIIEKREILFGKDAKGNLVTNNGMKLGSDSGDRSTAIVRSKQWFDKMGYDKEDQIINASINAGHGMEGAKARSTVNYAIDVVHQGIDERNITAKTIKDALGAEEFAKRGYTVGKMTKDEIRAEAMTMMADLMKKELGVNGAVKANLYQIKMGYDYGLKNADNVEVGMTTLSNFIGAVDKKFGTSMSKDDVIRGNVGYTMADVYNWENQVGYIKGRGNGGLVRWGDKEVNMIENRANQILGENNVLTKWLHGHVDKVAERQAGGGLKKYIGGLTQAVYDATDGALQRGEIAPKAGELIVSAQDDSFMHLDEHGNLVGDRAGKETGRVLDNGTHVVSTNAFKDLPEALDLQDKLTVGRYHQTILTAGKKVVDFNGEKKSLQNIIDANGGTFLYKLPEKFSHKYVRMIDQDLLGLGAELAKDEDDGRMPVLKRLQKAQLKLWRSVQDYNKYGAGEDNEYKDKVQASIDNYHNEVAYLTSSSQEGSISRISGAKMDMSGRFRSQGVNPFAKGNIKEGEYVVGKEQFKRMIGGAEEHILQSVGGEGWEKYKKSKAYWDSLINKEKDSFKRNQLKDFVYGEKLEGGGRGRGRLREEATKHVLDYTKENGLYGIVGRYPSIETDTLNVLKIRWDERIHGNNGVMGIATAFSMNADYDGDFISTVLSHYRAERGGPSGAEMHQALAKVHDATMNGHGQIVGLNALHDDIVNELKTNEGTGKYLRENNMTMDQLTVGDLAKIEGFQEKFLSKTGKLYNLETAIARLGKGDVGMLDNLRLRMTNIAKPAFNVLVNERGMSSELAIEKYSHIEEFGRIISQNAISSKKFTQAKILESMKKDPQWANASRGEQEAEMIKRMTDDRYNALDELIKGIQIGNDEGTRMIRHANETLELFKEEGFDEGVDLVTRYRKEQKYGFSTMLDSLRELRGVVGLDGWVQNLFQVPGTSMGTKTDRKTSAIEKMGQVLRNQGGLPTETPVLKHIRDASSEYTNYADEGNDIFKNTILSNYDRIHGNDNIFDALGSGASHQGATNTANALDTMTVAEGAGVKLRQVMGKVTGGMSTAFSPRGAMWGAATFGAMWAASAITRGGPTPEGLQEQTDTSQFRTPQQNSQPTARIQTNNTGEHINLSISAKDAKGLSRDQIAAMVQSELGAMTKTQMNMNLNVNDNTQDLSNSQWLQGLVGNVLDKGIGF